MANDKKIEKKAEPEKKRRIRPIKYIKDVQGELKKVTWPTGKELVSHTGAVFAFVIGMAILIGILDLLFVTGTDLLISIGNTTPVL